MFEDIIKEPFEWVDDIIDNFENKLTNCPYGLLNQEICPDYKKLDVILCKYFRIKNNKCLFKNN